MRTLSAALTAAQKSSSGKPYVKAVFSDYAGDRLRLRFSRYYTGAEPEGPIGVCAPGDGSLVRARIDPGTNNIYWSRVASPGSGSTYSSWTQLAGAATAGGGIALAANGATVVLFVANATNIYQAVSGDYGVSWGAGFALLEGRGVTVEHLAGAYAGDGDFVLFWHEAATVYRKRYDEGVGWGAAAAWSNSAASVTGLAAWYRGDWDVVVTGTAPTSTAAKVWTSIFGDGFTQALNTWSALKEVTAAVSGSNVTFKSPALAFLSDWYLWFVEKYTGSLAYSRLQRSEMSVTNNFSFDLWREPWAFDYTGEYGVAATKLEDGSRLAGGDAGGVARGRA